MIIPHRSQGLKPAAKPTSGGKVIFAAAGPGDPDLITIKAADALRNADVVLTDRLVSEVILHRYLSASAHLVYVGKECSKKASTPQSTINKLMVQYAGEGKTVVRLKGGDVSIFSNILDELIELMANNICYEIIPGVTAALGAAAYAGIPLTARGHATGVRFLTYYHSDVVTDDYWKEIAGTNDTLVFYMSAATINDVVKKLIQFGIGKEIQLAVIEQATTCFQTVHTCPVHDFEIRLKSKTFISPSLVIIGKVVALYEQFKWLENSDNNESYFASIAAAKNNIYELTHPVKNVI